VVYGQAGVGKTTLAADLPDPVFIDLDGNPHLNGMVVPGVETWQDVIDALAYEELWCKAKSVVIDSGTKAEELCQQWVVANIKHPDKPEQIIKSIEGYGWGRGFYFTFEAYTQLIMMLDKHVRAGRNVCIVCHDCVSTRRNPLGEDLDEYQPRLLSPPSGKGSIRHRVLEWCSHMVFLRFSEDKPDERLAYFQMQPGAWAKTRSVSVPAVIYEKNQGRAIWDLVFKSSRSDHESGA
jgi:hypothetical protein